MNKIILKNIGMGILLSTILNVSIDRLSLINIAEGIGFGILVGLLGAYLELRSKRFSNNDSL